MEKIKVTSYVDVLKQELETRVRTNPHYSLRAFARDIEVSPSQLSLVLKGKKGFSQETAARVARKLSLSEKDSEMFCHLVAATDAKSKAHRVQAQEQLETLQSSMTDSKLIAMDAFKVISDWHHFAIMELTEQKAFKSDFKYIADQLGLSRFEVEQAVERLERLDLLEKKNGQWKQTEMNLSTLNDAPSEAIKKFHRQVLQKAMDAITFQPVEIREVTALMIGIDQKDLPQFKRKIREFQSSINKMAEVQKNRTHIYCLSTQFFSLSKGEPK